MQLSVLIPTYRRPKDLERCLCAMANQIRPADEIIVVARRDDQASHEVLQGDTCRSLPLHVVIVDLPGLVTAMNLGLDAASGDVLAITDDDSAPFPDWLQRVEKAFENDKALAGVGGRDLIRKNGVLINQPVERVGQVLWYGKIIANHHLHVEKKQYVDLLKGVNCAYRLPLLKEIGFDRRLYGRGAQWHWELSLGLTLRKNEWKLLYDPEICVNHYPGIIYGDRTRYGYKSEEEKNRCHNETLVLLDYFKNIQRLIFLLWAILIGTTENYGVLQLFRYIFREKGLALTKFKDSMLGRFMGISTWLQQ